jgi:RimJ/RimL family protein N-acetyltransferase
MQDGQIHSLAPPEVLNGRRVMLRRYGEHDAAAVFGAVQESINHLRAWLPWYDAHSTITDSLAFINQTQTEWEKLQAFHIGMFTASGDYLGGCGLQVVDRYVPSFALGYWIRQTKERQGYVREAAELMTQCAFGQLGAERVVIYCDARNRRSAAVAEHCGYILEGTSLSARRDTAGGLADVCIYALIRSHYQQLQEQSTNPSRADASTADNSNHADAV